MILPFFPATDTLAVGRKTEFSSVRTENVFLLDGADGDDHGPMPSGDECQR